ncbi:hypothetical protein ASF30_11320 [Leifsonia sp. Leaf264]|nr:hypothetical protein ASF30_11320 [Leifsonia sp. Leaf264]
MTNGGRADDAVFNQLSTLPPLTEDGREISDGSLHDFTYWDVDEERPVSIAGILSEWVSMDGAQLKVNAAGELADARDDLGMAVEDGDEEVAAALRAKIAALEQYVAAAESEDPNVLWGALLEVKRADPRYEGIKQSLAENGWVRSLTARWSDEYEPMFCDGGHRLAAAIELGMTWVPVVLVEADAEVAIDSNIWEAGDRVPKRFRSRAEQRDLESGEMLKPFEDEDDYTDDDYQDDQYYLHVYDRF